MTANSLIEISLKEIARGYHPGALVWMKVNRFDKWREMLTLERRINKAALEGNFRGLREALNEYQGLILAAVKEYRVSEGFVSGGMG